ncbi:MAG TPA: SH3 domain-containing protein [Chloroflexota bacterium]
MPSPEAPPLADDVVVCPGCGGKNPSGSTECDWCGRPFLTRGGRLRLTIWQILSSLLLLGLIGAVTALAVLNAGRALPPARATASTATAVAPTVAPTPAVTPRVTAANPAPTSTPAALAAALSAPTLEPTPSEPPTPAPTPTPQLQQARITNTNGLGVTVRQQPGPQATRAGVLREGTVVLLTGNDQTVAARPWREIETQDHNLKGWVQGDFVQMVQTGR